MVLLLLAPAAHAGLNDPIPSPFTKQVYSVPGIVSDGVATVISCSSALSTPLNVGVQWFKKDGTPADGATGLSQFTIPAGGTVNFGSNGTVWLPIDAVMPGGATLKNGAARVLSTTTKSLLCNAFLVDPNNDPPKLLMHLPMMRGKAQKGD